MTRRTAAAVRAAHHHREMESAYADFAAKLQSYDDVPCASVKSEPKPHVTRIERDGRNHIFRCSCHAFGTWTTECEALAQAEAHKQKPWVKP